MAATGSAAIDKTFVDLYGEVCDFDQTVEASDLYDAVLTGSVSQKKVVTPTIKETKAKGEAKPAPAITSVTMGKDNKKYSVYIGNFSWWTSDKDLTNMAHTLGVKDIKEIKFAENRSNGQSRGYAEIILSTEDSLWKLVEKVPKCTLNGVTVDCRIATSQNMKRFEAVANKCMPLRVEKEESVSTDKVPVLLSQYSPQPVPPTFPQHLASQLHPLPNPFFRHMAPPPNVPPPPFPPMMPPPPPPQYMPPRQPPPVASQPPPSLHINPAFFPPGHGSHSSSQQTDTAPSQDGSFEEQMNRNRTIASSAITKAVTGAMTGDLRLAMETLLTAISVIKQSRVYSDERCQTLLTSLKDCLVSIQGNYNNSNSQHSQERERGPDRDRDRERDWDKDREREKDWDRERDWDRGRERHRDSSESRRRREPSWSEEDRDRMRDRERHTSRDHRDRYR